MYYLNGLMAGALTKSDKIGYVGAFPTPEVVRHIDAYALGVKATNPKAKVAGALDLLLVRPRRRPRRRPRPWWPTASTAWPSPRTPRPWSQVGEEHTKAGKQIYTFSHYSPMQKFGPDSCVSGQLVDWGVMYVKILEDIKDGKWTNADLWWLAGDKAADARRRVRHAGQPEVRRRAEGEDREDPRPRQA